MNSLFTLALIGGFHVLELTFGTTLGNLGYDKVEFPHPVFHGDTLFVESEVLEVRPSESKPDRGVVKVHTRAYNQDDTLVAEFKRAVLVPRKNPG